MYQYATVVSDASVSVAVRYASSSTLRLFDLAANSPGGPLPHRSALEEERVGDDDDDARDEREDETGVLEPDAEHLGDPEGDGRADWVVLATAIQADVVKSGC